MLVTEIGDGGAEKIVVSANGVTGVLSDARRHAEAVRAAQALLSDTGAGTRLEEADHGAGLLFEPVRPEAFHVVLLGAGHVGKALVRVLGELPCRVTWVDGRAEQFPREVPANVTLECTEMPQYAVERAPAGAAFLVMTHSHALDLTLCEKILRRGDFSYFGLIGSRTKRAKFVKRLQARGFADDADRAHGLSDRNPGAVGQASRRDRDRGRGAAADGAGGKRPVPSRQSGEGHAVNDEHSSGR